VTNENKNVVIAVCGLAHEDFEPDGTTVKSPYLRALKMCGGGYVLIPPGMPRADVEKTFSTCDGLLLIGGADIDPKYFNQPKHPQTVLVTPDRDKTDFLAFDLAQRRNLPILGICRGGQVINVARGGTLIQHLPDVTALPHRTTDHDATHEVICENNIPITHWPEKFQTNSAHHQAIDKLGKNLVVLARATDNTIEACGDPSLRYCLAVQWHPERILDQPLHKQLFTDFVSACRKYLPASTGYPVPLPP
jgi:putative glutamine amidotransferase